jgi:6,7-dimethyl-8-ribityllumazine synthase
LPQNIERKTGKLDGRELRIGIVVSRWNREITDELLHGALRALEVCSVLRENIDILEVPGAMEIPVAAEALISTRVDAIIAIGCVIKGETAHFEHVGRTALDGIAKIALKSGIPVTCGILTTYDTDQAVARSGLDDDNAGSQAALAAVEVANLIVSLQQAF